MTGTIIGELSTSYTEGIRNANSEGLHISLLYPYIVIYLLLFCRLRFVNYKEWRQSYKTLVLLEFLLTHGPQDMHQEFHCHLSVIRDLGKMNYVDESG